MLILALQCFVMLLVFLLGCGDVAFGQHQKSKAGAVKLDTLGKHLKNPKEKKEYVEAFHLKRHRAVVTRVDSMTLRVALKNKTHIDLVSSRDSVETDDYRFLDFWPEVQCCLFEHTIGERTTYLLVRRNNGQRMQFDAFPLLSPNRRRLATFSFNPQNADLPSRIQIWRIDEKQPKLEQQILYSVNESHWFDEGLAIKPKWVTSSMIEYEIASKRYKETKHVELKGKKWSHVVFVNVKKK